jgi:hypothetical protein
MTLIEHSQIASVLGLIDKLPETLVAVRPDLLMRPGHTWYCSTIARSLTNRSMR